jgi:DnaJ-class molecular chaperone
VRGDQPEHHRHVHQVRVMSAGQMVTCSTCNGAGTVPVSIQTPSGAWQTLYEACLSCGCTGEVPA